MLGLLESRKKRGMVIAEPDVFGGCKQILDSAFLNNTTQRGLYEMRLTLELGFSDLLFMRKTDKDLDELETIVKRELNARTEKARIKLEIEFHTKLYQIARNELLFQFQGLLEPFFREAVKREEKNGRLKSEVSHSDLLEALRNGAQDSFRQKMREHLEPHFVRLEQNHSAGEKK
jgi:DNA-binding FadR family transcriptional regulator